MIPIGTFKIVNSVEILEVPDSAVDAVASFHVPDVAVDPVLPLRCRIQR